MPDLKELAIDVKNRGVPLIAVLKGERFVKTAKKIAPHLEIIPDSELREQFREFLGRLGRKVAKMKPQEIDSLELIRSFIGTKEALS